MIKKHAHNLVLVVLIAIVSCSEENPSSSQFIIVSNSGTPANGIVSTYSYPSKKFEEEAYRFTAGAFRAIVTDAILSENELYVLKRDDSPGPDKIEVVNTSTWNASRSANLYLVTTFSRIATLHDKAFVAGSDFDGDMHLLVFNKSTLVKEDSLFLRDYVEIRKMIAHDNKLFISYNYIDSNAKLLILNGTNYEELEEFDLPYNCEDLLVDPDGNVLALHIKGLLKINSSTLESTLVEFPEGKVFYGPGGSSFGYDKKKNTIYYFSYAAQPAPALFHLSGFNLSTGLPISIPQEFIDATSISFNSSIGQIIVGAHHPSLGQGFVRLYDKQGNVLSDFLVPNSPLEILYK